MALELLELAVLEWAEVFPMKSVLGLAIAADGLGVTQVQRRAPRLTVFIHRSP